MITRLTIRRVGANEMIKIVAKGKLKPNVKVEEYLKFAKELAIETNKEKGCLSYVVHRRNE